MLTRRSRYHAERRLGHRAGCVWGQTPAREGRSCWVRAMTGPNPEPTAAWAAGGTVWPESGPARAAAGDMVTGLIHHLEFWVPDLDRSVVSWGWLLDELGYKPFGDWPGGRSWRAGHTYIVLEQSPDRTASRHDRKRPGLNHIAFHVADQDQV